MQMLSTEGTAAAGKVKQPAGGPLRILVVDDHAIVRQGIRTLLLREFPQAVFGEADDGQEALQIAQAEKWDLVLLDINLPGRSGIEILHELVVVRPGLPVLMLTMYPERQYAMRVLKAGAAGYVTKDLVANEVVGAIKTVIAGGRYVSSSLAEALAENLNSPPLPHHEMLSDREDRVLRLLAQGHSVKEIGFELSLSVKTVSTYRTRLLKKLRLKNNAEIIRYALLHGLVD